VELLHNVRYVATNLAVGIVHRCCYHTEKNGTNARELLHSMIKGARTTHSPCKCSVSNSIRSTIWTGVFFYCTSVTENRHLNMNRYFKVRTVQVKF